MSNKEKILGALLSGRVVGTRPADQLRFSCNQIPDAIRKIRKEFGHDFVITRYKFVMVNGRRTRVAEYLIPPDLITLILARILDK